MTRSFLTPVFIIAFCLNMAAQGAASQAPTEVRLDTPSGMPVPRFVSMKSDKTFCRAGPTFAHPIRITYQRRGLPVMVIAETRDHWRKVRDPEGDECWIHRTKLSGAQTAIVLLDGVALRARPYNGAMQKARLGQGLIARVERVEEGWVKVSAEGMKGWAPQDAFWGGFQ